MQKLIPGTKGQKHTTIVGAGHFLQEDKGEELTGALIDFMKFNQGLTQLGYSVNLLFKPC